MIFVLLRKHAFSYTRSINKTLKITEYVMILVNARQLGPRTTQTETNRPVSEDKSARMLRQLGPYYCFIILFNIYMCIIIDLYKKQLLSLSENELFIK
jgi:Na+/proline symporter